MTIIQPEDVYKELLSRQSFYGHAANQSGSRTLASSASSASSSSVNSADLSSNATSFPLSRTQLIDLLDKMASSIHVKVICLVAFDNDEEALQSYLSTHNININIKDPKLNSAAIEFLAYFGIDITSKTISLMMKYGSTIEYLALGYARGAHKSLAEKCVIDRINGQRSDIKTIMHGYVKGCHYELAEQCVTMGVNGTKTYISFLAQCYAVEKLKQFAERCVTIGLNGQKATIRDIAYGYAKGGHNELAEQCVTVGINGQKATAHDVESGLKERKRLIFIEQFVAAGVNDPDINAITLTHHYFGLASSASSASSVSQVQAPPQTATSIRLSETVDELMIKLKNYEAKFQELSKQNSDQLLQLAVANTKISQLEDMNKQLLDRLCGIPASDGKKRAIGGNVNESKKIKIETDLTGEDNDATSSSGTWSARISASSSSQQASK